mgnify:CR=1 FL=1
MALPMSPVSRPLVWSARAWFLVALASQWIFAIYITWVLARPLLRLAR